MIPNVCMSWCRRRALCKWCGKHIEAGTEMVSVFYWNKGDKETRWWNTKQYFHPQCWIEQGLDYLKMNPYVAYRRGPKVKLTKKRHARRLILLNRKAALDQRKRNLKSEYPDRALIEARMDRQIVEIMLEMTKVGGIPPKWLDTIG